MAVAPVWLIIDAEIVEPAIHRLDHAALDDRRQRLPAERAVASPYLKPGAFISFTTANAIG